MWAEGAGGREPVLGKKVRDMVERALSQVQAPVSWDSSRVVAYGLPGSEQLVHPPPSGQTKHTENGRSLSCPARVGGHHSELGGDTGGSPAHAWSRCQCLK